MHIRYRPALARLALTLVMIVFLVGLATLDANAEQRRVIVEATVDLRRRRGLARHLLPLLRGEKMLIDEI